MPRYRILSRKLDELTPAGQLIAHSMVILDFETRSPLADPVQTLLSGAAVPMSSYVIHPYSAETPATLYLSEPLVIAASGELRVSCP